MKTIGLVLTLALASMIAAAQQSSVPPAAKPDKSSKKIAQTQSVTGKTSQQGTAIDTSTAGSAGAETPGSQTDTGIVQQPGQHTSAKAPGTPAARPGAPPNWEQAGQEESLANINAAAASRAEIGGPYGTLGVNNALPPADRSAATPQAKATQNQRPTGTAKTGATPSLQKSNSTGGTRQQQ